MGSSEDSLQLASPDFSPDNKTLLLTYCSSRPCTLALYDLASGRLTVFQPPAGEVWTLGKFSPDGKKIVFTVAFMGDAKALQQIGIINADGSGYRLLTDTQDFKKSPSFSPDGKRILFARAGRENEGGRMRFADYDVYELDIASRKETRLTEFKFFLIMAPWYLPDGEHFIFSGEYPNLSKTYEERFQQNTILIMSKTERQLQPAITRGEHSDAPSISVDGKKILFISRSNDLDAVKCCDYNYDLFLKMDDGITRLTSLGSMITEGRISPDGRRVAFLSEKERLGIAFTDKQRRNRKQDLMVMNSDGTGLEKIELPKPSRTLQPIID